MQYLEYAYKNKNPDVITKHFNDNFDSAWVYGYGTLDVDYFNQTGEYKYYLDKSRPGIDQAIAELDPDSKMIFSSQVTKFQNANSMQFQIPRIKCPHCKRVIPAYPINMRSLFFEVRVRKGM
jgi:hypothetical protein